MKFLIDNSPEKVKKYMEQRPDIFCGQLLTPLTGYSNFGGSYALDNGAFSRFDKEKFQKMIERDKNHKSNLLFIVCPDVVGDFRRTLELFKYKIKFIPHGFPVALVAQDGAENMDIPWDQFSCLFLGGRDPWKDSVQAQAIVKTAKVLGKHVHIGRVNTFERWKLFSDLGADTCDGSGMAMYTDEMIIKFDNAKNKKQVSEVEQECLFNQL